MSLSGTLLADQPIMNMMPRWDHGWGIQLRYENKYDSDLLQGDTVIGDHFERQEILHLEGVYTWDRAVRLTIKIPYVVDAERTLPDGSGGTLRQRNSGLDDPTIALVFKDYFNLDGRSGNWTLAPQVRLPLGKTGGGYDLGDDTWGIGLSGGYEMETARWFFAAGIGTWYYLDEDEEPASIGASVDLGMNFADRGQILWETDFNYEKDDTHQLEAGPALYWRFTDTVHCRVEWKHSFISYQGELDHGNTDRISVGIGFVF